MVFVEAALHDDGHIDLDGAGAGFSIQIEVGVGAELKMNASRAAFQAPFRRGVATDLDRSRTCAGAEAT